jgi:hypothetical protein
MHPISPRYNMIYDRTRTSSIPTRTHVPGNRFDTKGNPQPHNGGIYGICRPHFYLLHICLRIRMLIISQTSQTSRHSTRSSQRKSPRAAHDDHHGTPSTSTSTSTHASLTAFGTYSFALSGCSSANASSYMRSRCWRNFLAVCGRLSFSLFDR